MMWYVYICEMSTTVKVIDILLPHVTFRVCVVRTLKINSIKKISSTILLASVTMLYIRSPELMHPI